MRPFRRRRYEPGGAPRPHPSQIGLLAEVPVELTGREFVRARDMPDSGPLPWLDRPDAHAEIEHRRSVGDLDDVMADRCRRFSDDGFVVIPGLFTPMETERVWDAFVRAVDEGTIEPSPERKGDDDPHPGHVMNAHLTVPEIWELFTHPALLDVVGTLLGVEPVPFQTLLFPKGREQLEHSDTIHMTTYPLGYMCAAWIALEDIDPASGPLRYYPGSHRLPRVFTHDVDMHPAEFREHEYWAVALKYEPYVQELIRSNDLRPETYLPSRGDVLIWHDNLIHGGSPRADVRLSRRSLVGHYFGRGAICYHDLSGKLAERVHDPAPAFPARV